MSTPPLPPSPNAVGPHPALWEELRSAGLAICTGLVACAACTATLHLAPDRRYGAFVAIFAVTWGLLLHVLPLPKRAGIILGTAIAIRMIAIGSPPLLSDDLYRYLWEGALLLADGDPFLTPPASVNGIDDDLRALVNHAHVTSIYPPLALWWFQLLAMMGRTAVVAQAATAALDVGTVALLLRDRSRSSRWGAALYALHPLPVLESAVGAHVDIVAIFLLTAALTANRGRVLLAVLGGSVKLLPFAAVPMLVARGPRSRLLGAGLLAIAVPFALAAPLVQFEPAMFDALRTYANHWSFNPLLFGILEQLAPDAARPLLAVLGLTLTVGIWIRQADPWRGMLYVGAVFLIVSPTVHPWYLLWVFIPAAALGERRWTLAATFFQASYLVLWTYDPSTGAWSAGPWLALVTWLPAAGALLIGRSRPLPGHTPG
ncbi:MAG: hypothetical protein ACI9K2_005098 [Myxococcota bacterium]|jgi:hypothetical protein